MEYNNISTEEKPSEATQNRIHKKIIFLQGFKILFYFYSVYNF